jgi:cellulase/cellobiase CelA1
MKKLTAAERFKKAFHDYLEQNGKEKMDELISSVMAKHRVIEEISTETELDRMKRELKSLAENLTEQQKIDVYTKVTGRQPINPKQEDEIVTERDFLKWEAQFENMQFSYTDIKDAFVAGYENGAERYASTSGMLGFGISAPEFWEWVESKFK